MTVVAKPLFESTVPPAAQTPLYTAPLATRTIIDKFTAYNSSSTTSATLAVNLIPTGGAVLTGNLVVVKNIQPGETYTFPELTGHVLAAGDVISVLPSAVTINVRSSGREVS